VDKLTEFMIDREICADWTLKLTLFRFFLEPSDEPVNYRTMSISGTMLDHSDTYTFGEYCLLKIVNYSDRPGVECSVSFCTLQLVISPT
jgi:hypothetical protein